MAYLLDQSNQVPIAFVCFKCRCQPNCTCCKPGYCECVDEEDPDYDIQS